ncbi:MAG: hypothetical protein IIA89_08215 [Chloroflexi bacterium]|nr:hypothetical protein [Chloroflexota bacterium]
MDKNGRRLGTRYPKLLVAFAAWGAIGVAIVLIISKQAICGTVMIGGSIAAIALAIDGRLMKERVYTKADLLTQWLVLPLPLLTVGILMVTLGRSVLGPYLAYVFLYWVVLAGVLAAAALELRRGVKVA